MDYQPNAPRPSFEEREAARMAQRIALYNQLRGLDRGQLEARLRRHCRVVSITRSTTGRELKNAIVDAELPMPRRIRFGRPQPR